MFNVLDGRSYVAGCKKWQCYPCGRRRAKEIFHRLAGYRFERLVTLTAPAHTQPTSGNVKRFNYGWKRFKQALVRRHGRFDYLWSNEAGSKSGQLHKHIAMPWFRFDYRLARDSIESIPGLGAVCDFGKKRPVKHKRALNYCVKYVTKDQSVFPRYSRRVQCSVHREHEQKEAGWKFLSINASLRAQREAAGVPFVTDWFHWHMPALSPKLALIQEEKLHALVLPGEPGEEDAA